MAVRVFGIDAVGPTLRVCAQAVVVRKRRLVQFLLVGASGVVVNSAVLYLLAGVVGLHHVAASAVATEVAILSNFLLNDHWTFAGVSSHLSRFRRIARYNLVCLGGLVLTVAMLAALTHWLRIHYLVANLLTVPVAAIWNYLASTFFAWAVTGSVPDQPPVIEAVLADG